MNETCDAINSWCGSEWPCGEPAVGRYRRACVHEHPLSHECAITLTLLEPDRNGAA